MKALSIVIINYNTKALILCCLQSIMEQAPDTCEIIVVDNHSTDGSTEAIKRQFPGALLIENERNEGYAKAVNKGLVRSRGEWILVLNSDIELRPHALQNSIEFMRNHLDTGIAGCKLFNPDGTLQPSCEGFPSLWNILCESFFLDKLFPRSRLFGKLHMTYFNYDRAAKVDRVMGAFLLIRKTALAEIGFMDEQFFFYSEEVDWCYRAWQKGWAVYFFPDAEAIHYGGGSADPVSPALFIERHKNRFLFYRKYHDPLSSFCLRMVAALGIFLRLVAWSCLAIHRGLWKKASRPASTKKVRAYWATLKWYLGLAFSPNADDSAPCP